MDQKITRICYTNYGPKLFCYEYTGCSCLNQKNRFLIAPEVEIEKNRLVTFKTPFLS